MPRKQSGTKRSGSKKSTKQQEPRKSNSQSGSEGQQEEKQHEHPPERQHSASSQTTTDHETIQRWAEERGGIPACVQGTGDTEDVGIIRIEFPDRPNSRDQNLQDITWEEFFEKFDDQGLALVFQEETSEGQKSNFNKLVKREAAARKASAGR